MARSSFTRFEGIARARVVHPEVEPSEPLPSDVAAMRTRARENFRDGAISSDYGLEPARVIAALNEALAMAIVCQLRYKRHFFVARGLRADVVAAEFLENARHEQMHADALSKRIVTLGGWPDLDPRCIAGRSRTEYSAGVDLETMIEDDLVAERIGIESYRSIIRWLGDGDPTTRRMLEDILAVKEEHADELRSLLRKR